MLVGYSKTTTRDVNGKFAPKSMVCSVIVAAETHDELVSRVNKATKYNQGIVRSEMTDHLVEFKSFKKSVFTIYHSNEEEQHTFSLRYDLKLFSHDVALEYHKEMLAGHQLNIGYTDNEMDSDISIEELYGLDKSDIWDQRPEEMKVKSSDMEEKMKQAKQKIGKAITGSSFDPNPRGAGGIRIKDVNITSSGNINISAHKSSEQNEEIVIPTLQVTMNDFQDMNDLLDKIVSLQTELVDRKIFTPMLVWSDEVITELRNAIQPALSPQFELDQDQINDLVKYVRKMTNIKLHADVNDA
jgi:hypothetical protein